MWFSQPKGKVYPRQQNSYNWLKCRGEAAERAAPCCNSILFAFLNQTVTNTFTLFLFLKGKGTYFISKQLIPSTTANIKKSGQHLHALKNSQIINTVETEIHPTLCLWDSTALSLGAGRGGGTRLFTSKEKHISRGRRPSLAVLPSLSNGPAVPPAFKHSNDFVAFMGMATTQKRMWCLSNSNTCPALAQYSWCTLYVLVCSLVTIVVISLLRRSLRLRVCSSHPLGWNPQGWSVSACCSARTFCFFFQPLQIEGTGGQNCVEQRWSPFKIFISWRRLILHVSSTQYVCSTQVPVLGPDLWKPECKF